MTVITQLAAPPLSGAENIYAQGINASGEVVGYTNTSSGSYAVVWRSGVATTTFIPGSGDFTQGCAINDQGEVVGGTNNDNDGYFLLNGAVTALPSLGGADKIAYGLNDRGNIVGQSQTPTGTEPVATEWVGGKAIALATLPGAAGADSLAFAVNNSGEVVGYSYISATSYSTAAVVWQSGAVTALPTLAAGDTSSAHVINSSGEVAGTDTPASGKVSAVIWQNSVISKLANLPGANSDYVWGINDSGVVVGMVQEFLTYDHAVAWVDGQAVDLNTLLAANSGWVLQSATGINDNGMIVGNGTYEGKAATFELTLGSDLTPLDVTAATALATGTTTPVAVKDSAANIVANLDALEQLTYSGRLVSVSLTDSGTPVLSLTSSQSIGDGDVLLRITGGYSALITPSSSHGTVYGSSSALGTTVELNGLAAGASFAAAGDGATVTVTLGSTVETLKSVQAVQFSDMTVIIAQAPGSASSVTTGNVTELYSAVLAREPDLGGLVFYQNYLKSNPGTSLQQFAEYFLSSTEYTSNPLHSYAQNSSGDTQFITDSYENLLHRTPSSSEVSFYETNVMQTAEAGLTPGTQAFATAQFQAHALMLVYFSASSEFLSDVQVTASNPASTHHWLVLI